MRVWNIKDDDYAYDIDLDQCTILKGQHMIWHNIVRSIDSYFNNRFSDVQITEDTQPINKKDWNCYLIPYDFKVETERITAKSPLNSLLTTYVTELGLSPSFFELQEVWSEVQEECYFANKLLEPYELHAEIRNFEEKDLKSFISFKTNQKSISPLDNKMMLLRFIQKEAMNKQTLILIELPEVYSTKMQLEILMNEINAMRLKGIHFIIITNELSLSARKNFIVSNEVFNESAIESVKREVLLDIPSGAEGQDFIQAKEQLLTIVDNYPECDLFKLISYSEEQTIQLLMYMILRKLSIHETIDMIGFPENIVKFMSSY
ncbi:hypothetical protein CSV79_07630 [Sporosarcina sp. P13]|uniref:hypothetical protein n=1 Tax=Sporosarcina sp. P13 TaxID=2048263 RepID=UPI000C168B61|nr:hypothetical protein [Sporosarcina sp. P13]PIC64190.1 hypothetical protein CSV79_07630 [Sporosarcina sp. P13]